MDNIDLIFITAIILPSSLYQYEVINEDLCLFFMMFLIITGFLARAFEQFIERNNDADL